VSPTDSRCITPLTYLPALAFLHPISAAIIGFYAVASDWEVADFCYRNVPKSRIPEHLADATSKAMKLLRYIVTDLAPGEIMVFAPDVITVRAARSAVFLTRVSYQYRMAHGRH
jgi:hypothetical protein